MHGTIHTGASWIWSARYWAASSIRVNRSGLVPGALVVGPHRLLDHGVPDDEEPPALHIAARRRTDARLQNFSDQLGRHGVWLQAPHRSGRRHDLEQVWGFLRHDILERQNCSSSYTRIPDGHVGPSHGNATQGLTGVGDRPAGSEAIPKRSDGSASIAA